MPRVYLGSRTSALRGAASVLESCSCSAAFPCKVITGKLRGRSVLALVAAVRHKSLHRALCQQEALRAAVPQCRSAATPVIDVATSKTSSYI